MDCKVRDCDGRAAAIISRDDRRVAVCAEHERKGIRGGWSTEALPDAPKPKGDRNAKRLKPQRRPKPQARSTRRYPRGPLSKDDAPCCEARRLPDGRPVIGWCGPDCIRRPGNR